MAPTKSKGDLAEMMVAADLLHRGFKIAFPHGEDWDYDLIVEREGALERVQVKHVDSGGDVIHVRCCSHSLTNGKVRRTKHYTTAMVDWIAVWDSTSRACYYVHASELGGGRRVLHLRLRPTRNNQVAGIRWASDYTDLVERRSLRLMMEPAGLEPAAFAMQTRRSPN